MISEKKFIKDYTGFWNSLFPLYNTFMKGVILECSQNQVNIGIKTSGRRFSFVSEVGYQMFVIHKERKKIKINNCLFKEAEYICTEKFKLFNDNKYEIIKTLNFEEKEDAILIYKALTNKFIDTNIDVNPRFIGCGILDTCYGDVLEKDTLYEIKTVSRNFNISDFRQLITYCTLNYISKKYNIKNIALYNPKNSTTYKIGLEMFSSAIAGISISDIYWNIINFISCDSTSR